MKSTTELIQECQENNVGLTLIVKKNELKEVIHEMLEEVLTKNGRNALNASPDEEITYSVEQVMEQLKIKNRATIWRWQRSGYLPYVKVGKFCRYKKSDIDNIINGRNYM